MKFSITFKPSASKDIDNLPIEIGKRILFEIEKLQDNPWPLHCKKIVGSKHDWRLRIGNYRVLYEVNDAEQQIRVFRIKHRKEAYR
ncbi:MAG: type II toxin-antitoxin system RelE/ParE family toxin [Bacteroidetes bacterium]|nr:type II toxin-antitoxin system RelE/ParE family toxin [Bacteroidota bacterium]MBU1423771.1 type II toxin-antitoxin system RelE/ParE family toxin [Bacteroidota bacterium]